MSGTCSKAVMIHTRKRYCFLGGAHWHSFACRNQLRCPHSRATSARSAGKARVNPFFYCVVMRHANCRRRRTRCNTQTLAVIETLVKTRLLSSRTFRTARAMLMRKRCARVSWRKNGGKDWALRWWGAHLVRRETNAIVAWRNTL